MVWVAFDSGWFEVRNDGAREKQGFVEAWFDARTSGQPRRVIGTRAEMACT